MTAPIAFFDVDETLISIKSMFDFYDYYLAAVGHTVEEQQDLQASARALITSGMPREQGNRLFYKRFGGRQADEVAEIGLAWFDDHMSRGELFHTDVLDALRAHTAAGTSTVLVSGSFSACLGPISAYCGADVVCGTELEVVSGVYTGEVTRTMIGGAKAEMAETMIAAVGVPAADCYAYGDHTSDLGLLQAVGHPVLIGTNAEMNALADEHGWARLAGTIAATAA